MRLVNMAHKSNSNGVLKSLVLVRMYGLYAIVLSEEKKLHFDK